MSEHTKGPWEWDGNVWDYDPDQEAPWLVSADGAKILTGTIQCPSKANARLVAAAPELLGALEDLLDAIPKQTNDADWWPDELTRAVREAKAAIAKAEGK